MVTIGRPECAILWIPATAAAFVARVQAIRGQTISCAAVLTGAGGTFSLEPICAKLPTDAEQR